MSHIEITGADLLRLLAAIENSYPIASLSVKTGEPGAVFKINGGPWSPILGNPTGDPAPAPAPEVAKKAPASRPSASRRTTRAPQANR